MTKIIRNSFDIRVGAVEEPTVDEVADASESRSLCRTNSAENLLKDWLQHPTTTATTTTTANLQVMLWRPWRRVCIREWRFGR